MKRQSGFTLIELVMVIVILGILSAFALPRFADLGGDARVSAVNGIAGAIRSASAIARADFLVKGDTDTGTAGVQTVLEGQTILMVNGFPEVGATLGTQDIVVAAQIDLQDASFDTSNSDATNFNLRLAGAPTPATCAVTYTEATATAPPAIAVLTAGCQ